MSVRALSQCWGADFPVKARGLSPQTIRLVALAVADVVNDLHHNEFWGARRLLAEKVGCDPDTVGDVLKHLCATGVAEVVASEPGSPVRYRWRCGEPPQGCGEPPQEVRSTTAGGAVLPPHNTKGTETNSKELASPPASAKRRGKEPTLEGQAANRVARAWYDEVKATTGKVPVGIRMPGLVRLLTPFLWAGWSEEEVAVALRAAHVRGDPLTRQVIERHLQGRGTNVIRPDWKERARQRRAAGGTQT